MKRIFLSRRWTLPACLLSFCFSPAAAPSFAAGFVRDSLVVAADHKVTVTPTDYPGLKNPNARGWYYKCANVVQAKDGALVVCFQLSDNHTSLSSYIMAGRSVDGGKTWGEFQVIDHADVWQEQAIWVVPQMSVLKDGRIAVICDRGQRNPKQDFPMLSDWQKPDRGMANYLFFSSDNGKTWSKGAKVDDIGCEPGYILEMSNGTLAYTRVEPMPTHLIKNPPLPWGNNYYRNVIVFSRDGGANWNEHAILADDPFTGDSEVGLVELEPGHLIGATRVGLGNGRFGQPSRLVHSRDFGRTWEPPTQAPFYGQRVHLQKLQSGKLLATYRNVWGTPGSRALVFDPAENLGFQPTSWILDEKRCELTPEAMTLRTGEGASEAVEFSFYPAQDDQSRVEIEATMRLESADDNGCAISAGCWIRFLPDRVCLGDRPAAGFALNTREWHTYRIVREKGTITISVDGKPMLNESIADIWAREVRFGNRSAAGYDKQYQRNAAVSSWRSFAVKVANQNVHSIDWKWQPSLGYPDQFRRDRVVVLDYAYPADCGYSSWTQLPDGKIVIVDYTNGGLEDFSWSGKGGAPFIRAYLVNEKELVR